MGVPKKPKTKSPVVEQSVLDQLKRSEEAISRAEQVVENSRRQIALTKDLLEEMREREDSLNTNLERAKEFRQGMSHDRGRPSAAPEALTTVKSHAVGNTRK